MPYSVSPAKKGKGRWVVRTPSGVPVASGLEATVAEAERIASRLDRRWYGERASDPPKCETGKKDWVTEEKAREFAVWLNGSNLRRNIPGIVNAYQCDRCGGWHVGRRLKQAWSGGGAR